MQSPGVPTKPKSDIAGGTGSATNNKFPKTHEVFGYQPNQNHKVRGVAF